MSRLAMLNYIKSVNGVSVPMTEEEALQRQQEEASYVPSVSLQTALDKAFLGILPKHLGQPYLTGPVITTIMQARGAVNDSLTIDPSGALGKAIVGSIQVPSQMSPDQAMMLSLFP